MNDAAVAAGKTEEYTPLTPGQERSWILADLAAPAAPQLSVGVGIRGPVDLDALRSSLRWVQSRHPSLRTRVAAGARQRAVVQRAESSGGELAYHDLSGEPPPQHDEQLAELGLHAPLRTDGALARYTLVRFAADRHELHVMMHALAADRHSVGVFLEELLEAYRAFSAAVTPQLPDPSLRFTDHARACRQPGSEHGSRGDLEYWQESLAGLPDPLELPFALPRAAQPSFECKTVPFSISTDVTAALRRLGAQESASPAAVLTTALVILLHRYCGRDDIVLGTPVSGRLQPGADRVIGPFQDVLPVRFLLPYDPTWREALQLVRDVLAETADHQAVAFGRIVEQTRPARRVNMHPLFQILVGPVRPLRQERVAGQTVFTVHEPITRCSPFDIELYLEEPESAPPAPGGLLSGFLRYNASMFGSEQAGTLLRHLLRQLEQLATVPDAHLSNLPLLDTAEHSEIVHKWNSTKTDYPRERCVHTLVEERAFTSPEAPALRWEDTRLTYRELDARANRLANYLRGIGVRPEARVGLFFGYTAAWVISALATLKAGGTFVPLDPAYPPERLAAMCEDAQVEVLLHGNHEGSLPFDRGPAVHVGVGCEQFADQPATAPPDLAVPDNLAYVMFTSGSTGRPKAIGVTHRNIVRTVVNTNYVAFLPGDTVGQASNISFDAVTLEAWGALLAGALLVGLRKEQVMQPQLLKRLLVENGIDIFFIPSALMKQVVSEAPDTFASLRYFLSGGEQADFHTLVRLLAHGAPQHLVNPYGPTETTVFAITYRCNDLKDTEQLVPIGYPISNTTCYVLDRYRWPVPAGVVGEIFVGGDGVARGYLGQPGVTADRFVPDPFGDEPGARLYRTGDLGRYRYDGAVEFLGRIDRQVKIRGFRIEPGDVEACLLRSGQVSQAAVQVGRDAGGDDMLIAYLVPQAAALDLDDVRSYLRGQLPTYLLPGAFVTLPSLPLNANGKLDAHALARLTAAGTGGTREIVEPRTATEGRLDALWRETLDAEAFGIHDDFFELGGDSLAATSLAARIRAVFRCEVPLRLLFEFPTISALAEVIDKLRTSGPPPTPVNQEQSAAEPGGEPARHAPEAAASPTRDRVAGIWREVLDSPAIGIHDDFFAVGGHSLKAIKIVSRIRADLGVEVPLALVFEHRTIAGLADAIDAVRAESAGVTPEAVPAEQRDSPAAGPAAGVRDLIEHVADLSDDDIERLLVPGS